jgi:hypothetical protein
MDFSKKTGFPWQMGPKQGTWAFLFHGTYFPRGTRLPKIVGPSSIEKHVVSKKIGPKHGSL